MKEFFITQYTKTFAITCSVILLLITVGISIFINHSIRNEVFLQFVNDTKPTTGYIDSQMNLYTNVLYGTRAFFNASQEVLPVQWHDYITALDLRRNYPGVTSLFYAPRVDPTKSAINIYPSTKDLFAYPITYLEPYDKTRAKAIGFNVASEVNRLRAMNESVRTDQPIATPMILSAISDEPIISIYIPIYNKGVIDSFESRKQEIKGFATVSFKVEEVFGYFKKHMALNKRIGLQVYDTASLFDANASTLIYDTTGTGSLQSNLLRTDTITVGGRPWLLVYVARPGYQSDGFDTLIPLAVLCIGIVFSFLFPFFFYYRIQHKYYMQTK